MPFDGRTDLQRELAAVLNRHCVDAETDTPDYILAAMLVGMINAYRATRIATQRWFGEASPIPHARKSGGEDSQ